MKLTIFGATGRTGSHVVEQALTAGYEVTAFVRDPAKLTAAQKHLMFVQGDATNPDAVDRAVCGTDAVISVMGSSSTQNNSEAKPLTRATQNIIYAMKKHGVRRLIVSSAGIHQQNDLLDIRFSILMGIGKLIMPANVEDQIEVARTIQDSELDWTIIRMAPSDAPKQGNAQAGYMNKSNGMFIARADAAAFILNELKEKKWLQKVPIIFNPRG